MLEITGLSTSYGAVQALKDVTFSVPDGSITAVLGANGAGKTTLLRTITGMVRPKSGRVTFGDNDLTRMAVEDIVRLGVSHVPEGRGVIQELTVDENLRLGALWRRDRDDRKRALEEMYELFPPLAARKRRSGVHPVGRRAADAGAGPGPDGAAPGCSCSTSPAWAWPRSSRPRSWPCSATWPSQKGLTVLLVEQNARSALSIADRGVVLSLGQVVATEDAAVLAGDADLRHHYLGF